ncbi:MAG TPA: hypothetical protein VGK31_06675 [Thermoanaerobaculia bacterium]
MRLVLSALIVAAPLHAGLLYDFVTTIESPRYSVQQTGRVTVRGMIVRHELEVTRAFENGQPQTERTVTVIRNRRCLSCRKKRNTSSARRDRDSSVDYAPCLLNR